MTGTVPAHEIAQPTRAEMQALADAPLADPGKLYLPMGKRRASRGPKAQYEGEFCPKLTGREARERVAAERDKKLGTILNYYATTDIPFERIAAHTKQPLETIIRVMKVRGREYVAPVDGHPEGGDACGSVHDQRGAGTAGAQ